MNGQMFQIAGLVAAAKSALQSNNQIKYNPEKYVNSISFKFLILGTEDYIAYNSSEWFEKLKEFGLVDIKLLCPISVKDRSILGFSNTTQSSILCFFENGKVTYFIPNWEFDNKHQQWNIMYKEYEWTNPPEGKPRYDNNSDSFRKVLLQIKDLAAKIDCENFANIFEFAIQSLDGKNEGIDKEYGLELPQIPRQNLKLFEAASRADVFGAMGSWNDSPPYMAQNKGLEEEYDILSDELLKNIRLAILYSINEW